MFIHLLYVCNLNDICSVMESSSSLCGLFRLLSFASMLLYINSSGSSSLFLWKRKAIDRRGNSNLISHPSAFYSFCRRSKQTVDDCCVCVCRWEKEEEEELLFVFFGQEKDKRKELQPSSTINNIICLEISGRHVLYWETGKYQISWNQSS
jgi:hypothetical protein